MKNIYESVPTFENEHYLLRLVQKDDARNLLGVYGDKNALPFFNNDNCHGDNFYYPTIERMETALDFWLKSYESKWFVRWSVIEKAGDHAVGSIELFHREADDYFNHTGLLRLDLASNFERADAIEEISALILSTAYELFCTDRIITKIPFFAVERKSAFEKLGFVKSEEFLVGTQDGYPYSNYWERKKEQN